MIFDLSEENELIRATVRQFADEVWQRVCPVIDFLYDSQLIVRLCFDGLCKLLAHAA